MTAGNGAGQRRVRRRTVPAPVLACTLHPELPAGDQHRLAPGRTPTGANVKQIVQPVSGGPVTLLDVPRPVPEPTEVLVRTLSSVISPGTERAVTALAQSSLLAKARARPDLVRQVVQEGPHRGDREHPPGGARPARPTTCRSATPPPGWSSRPARAVTGIRPGQLVATGGAGKANHAEFQAVPGLLCAPVPGRRQRSGRRVHHASRRSRCTGCESRRQDRARRSWWSASG